MNGQILRPLFLQSSVLNNLSVHSNFSIALEMSYKLLYFNKIDSHERYLLRANNTRKIKSCYCF